MVSIHCRINASLTSLESQVNKFILILKRDIRQDSAGFVTPWQIPIRVTGNKRGGTCIYIHMRTHTHTLTHKHTHSHIHHPEYSFRGWETESKCQLQCSLWAELTLTVHAYPCYYLICNSPVQVAVQRLFSGYCEP